MGRSYNRVLRRVLKGFRRTGTNLKSYDDVIMSNVSQFSLPIDVKAYLQRKAITIAAISASNAAA